MKKCKVLVFVMLTSCIMLTSCSKNELVTETVNTVNDKLQMGETSSIGAEIIQNASMIEEEINGDYLYWKPKTLNYSDRTFWDMTDNDGSGCKTGEFIYYTQLVNPVDLGMPVGQPIEEFMVDLSTEQNVLWSMSGYKLGEWGAVSAEETVKYDMYDCSVFSTEALGGSKWTFMVHRYAMSQNNDDSTKRTYFNIMGLSEFNGEWLTMELTGNYADTETDKIAVYKDILAEFAEIYGFMETFEAKRADCADYFIGAIM